MIFTDRTITVRKGESRIDEPIVVYRGDYELEVRFTILNSRFKFMSGTNMIESEKASYGQLAILTPYGGNIFSDIVRCNDGSVTFVLTAEMLNQIEEVGLYSFQIRLMDYNKESRVSIPPIEFGIEVREPIASEDHDNEVNNAIVGYSIAKVVDGLNEDVPDTFDANGQYNKTDWETGDRISEGKLNKIEDALDKINRNEKTDIAAMNKKVDSNYNVLDSKIDEVATKGTTSEVIERATKDEINRQIADGIITNLTIANHSITDEKIAFNGVSKDKTSFFKKGKNLFNPETAIAGYFVNQENGKLGPNELYTTSDFIPIKPDTDYVISGLNPRWALYDDKFMFIKGDSFNANITTTGESKYVRFSFSQNSGVPTQLEEGTVSTAFEPFSQLIPFDNIEAHTHNYDDIFVKREQTEFYSISKNLYNNKTVTVDHYVNQGSGKLSYDVNHVCSDYINVKPNTNYVLNIEEHISSLRCALYDKNKKYIIGYLGERQLLTTADTAFLVFSYSTNMLDDIIQLEEGTESTDYEPYYKIIPASEVERVAYDFNEIEGVLAHEQTPFFTASSNMINIDTCVSGYISAYNGKHYDHSAYWHTDYIEISNGYYTIQNTGLGFAHSACYDANKIYICPSADFMIGDNGEIKTMYMNNDNVCYIRLSIANSGYFGSAYFHEGDTVQPYEKFGYYLKDEYIKKDDTPTKGIIVNLPRKLYALVGEEFNIYYDNILEGRDTDYIIDVACAQGQQMERCYRLVPTVGGQVNITINVYDKQWNFVGSASSTIIIATAEQGTDVTRSVIILGDSTTNNGICVSKLNLNFENDAMNIQTLGTRGSGANMHEGRSGWTYNQYFTVAEDSGAAGVLNPFYNPSTQTFDYQYYCDNSGVAIPDYFFINLGINDTFSYGTDETLQTAMETLVQRADAMIESIHSVDPSIKIGMVLTIPPNYSQDAFGKAYKCNQYRDRYKRNNVLWVQALIERYDNRENEGIYVIPLHCNLDTKYNFGLEEIKINKRNDKTYESPIGNGGVHPVDSGYWQCADTYWFFLKALES